MNENEQARIAAMAAALRPDWPLASLRTLLARPELANRARRDVAVALAWVACEAETTTPARVIESGPWWRAANVEHPDRTIRRPPLKSEECHTHPGEFRDLCRCCVSERKAARQAEAQGPQLPREEAIAAARAEIRDAIGGDDLCSHGVRRDRCADHDPRRNKPTETPERVRGELHTTNAEESKP